jgi:hypothetical protein
MASSGNPRGGPVRRVAILGRVVQLGRGRIEALEERIDQLEALLEALQDAVHRESVREQGRIGALEKQTEPSEISRALSRDARERGL